MHRAVAYALATLPEDKSDMDNNPGTPPRYPYVLAGALLGLAAVLLIHRYGGINHDAPLYLGQALQQRWPDTFANDLFFAHGSQGSYTLFPWLIGLTFDWAAPPTVFLWGSLAGILLFAGAGWYCLSGLLPKTQRYWAWLGVLCLPTMYGRTIIFSYHEPFFTPRPFAEALCLLGIGLLVRGRWRLALACAVSAGLLHPLQAIAAALIVWPWLVMRDRRWLHAAWLTIPVALLAIAGIPPLDGLFRPIDSAWLLELRQTTGQLFLTGWPSSDHLLLAFDAFILIHGWRTLRGPFGAWCLAALAGLALGISANLVLVDGLHLVLPAGLQLWRVHWLAHWFAMATIALLLHRDIGSGELARAACLGLTALLVWSGAGWMCLPFVALYACWPIVLQRTQRRVSLLLGLMFALGMFIMLASYVANEFLQFRLARFQLQMYAIDRRLLIFPMIAIGLPLLGSLAWSRLGRSRQWLLIPCILLPLLTLATMRWDARLPHRAALEKQAFQTGMFGVSLPANAQVYWDNVSLVGTWLALRKADYFDPQQLSGMMFNRGTIFDARARLARIEPLILESTRCQTRNGAAPSACRVSDESMRLACAPGPTKRPDYIVLPYLQPQHAQGSWSLVDPATKKPVTSYWIYGCDEIMADLGVRSKGD